jgi:predicted nucleotidyltransferase
MNTIRDEIIERLVEIEKEDGIQILYACESGSRAWGFASPDSDFDIRFIFKRPLSAYLVVKDMPDTLEYPIQNNLDFSGWDLKKFMLHFHKSNGVMFEWLQSPVVYCVSSNFLDTFHKLMPDYFNPRSMINHYLGLTKRTLLDFGDSSEVKLKKYFYILRPLLAARWVHRKKSVPPMDFESLLISSDIDKTILTMIVELKQKKEKCDETQLISRMTDLEAFVKAEILNYESNLPESQADCKSISELNELLLHSIVENR